MGSYKDMIEMIGKFKHVPEILANPDNAYNKYYGGGKIPKYKAGGGTGYGGLDPVSQWFTSGGADGGMGTPKAYQPYNRAMGDDGNLLTGESGSLMGDDTLASGGAAGSGYQGLTPYGSKPINHPLIVPKVTSFKKGGKMYFDGGKKKAVTEEEFNFTSFKDLTKKQQTELLKHFTSTEGYLPNGHLATKESGITFGSGLDAKALITEQDYIDHGVSKKDAKTIVAGLKYTKKNGKVYDMAGKSSQKIQKDLGLTKEQLEEYVGNIKFSNTTQSDIVSKSVDKNFNNNSDLFNKVSNFKDFTVLSSVVHFTGDSHFDEEGRGINRNKNSSTKRALQLTIADLMNKYDGKLTSKEFYNVMYQTDKIVDDQGGIGVRTDVSHPGDESATFNRWNKELNYSLGTLGEDYEHDETKYYTIDVDDLGKQGSSDKKALTYYDATYEEPEVLPTEGMNMTPTQDINQNLIPSESYNASTNPYENIDSEYNTSQTFKKGGLYNEGGNKDYADSYGSKKRGAFPRMKFEDSDEFPNLNVGENVFMALSMAQYYGYTGDIEMTSGQRGGKDQTRVYGKYQRDDAYVYGRYPQYQQAIADSLGVSLRDYKRNDVSDEEWENQDVDYMTNWINNIWSQVQSGEMTMKEADKIYPMEHMTGDAGDFTGGFKRWLNSSESKQFRKDFNVSVLNESDHFHVTFGESNVDNLPEEHQADYFVHQDQFNNLSVESSDVAGTTVINMNPSVYQGEQRNQLYGPVLKLENIEASLNTTQNLELQKASPMYEGDVAYSNYLKENSERNEPLENLGLMELAKKSLSREDFFNKEGYDINYNPAPPPPPPAAETVRVGDHGVPFQENIYNNNPYNTEEPVTLDKMPVQGNGFTTLDKSIPEGTNVTPSTLPQINNGNIPTVQQYNEFLYEQEVKSKTDNIFRMINPYGK